MSTSTSLRLASISATVRPVSLRFAAFDKALLKRVVPFREGKIGPGQFERRVELLDEVAHAAGAAGEMIGQERPHEGPAHAGGIDDRIVDILGRADALVEDVQRLAPQGFLEAIADIAVDLLLEAQHMHADRFEIDAGAIHGVVRGLLAGNGLDQRQQIDRVEGVADDHALRMLAFGLEARRQKARRGRGDDHVGAGDRIDILEELDLQRLALGRGLMDEIGARRHRLQDRW